MTHILNLPWHIDLLKSLVLLAAQCIQSEISGPDLLEDEKSLFKYNFMLDGLQEQMEIVQLQNDFLEDLQKQQGIAGSLHRSMKMNLESKRKFLPVPAEVEEIVDQALRAILCALIKHSVSDYVGLLQSLSSFKEDPHPVLVDLWTLVYVSSMRPWLKTKVQELCAQSEEMDVLKAYRQICSKILETCNILIKLPARPTPSSPQDVLGFVKQLVPAEKLQNLYETRQKRALQRVSGLQNLKNLLQLTSYASIRQEVVSFAAKSLQSMTDNHYLSK